MDSYKLKNIIQKIQTGEGIDLSAIAKKAEVNRSYLSTLINSEDKKDATDSLIGKLTKAYPAYFNGQQKPTDDIGEVLANLRELRGYAIAILTEQQAGQKVMIGSLERLEKQPEGSLSEVADKLALKILEKLNTINKSNQGAGGKART